MASLLRALTQHWQLKLLAFALAVLLWIVVSGEQVQSRSLPIPLEVRVSDPNHQLVEGSVPREVEVSFVGPGREFLDLALRRPRLVLEVAEVEDAEEVFELQPGMVQVPGQLEMRARGVDPGRVRLRFQRLESRMLPVQLRYGLGHEREWTLVDPPRVEPERVEVSGPAERVADLDGVPTVPLRLAAGDSAFERELAIDTSSLRGLRLATRRVKVRGEADQLVERTLNEVAVSVGPGVQVTPGAVSVRVRGPRRMVGLLEPTDLRVVIAIDSLPVRIPEGGMSVPLRVETGRPNVQGAPIPAVVRLFPLTLPGEPASPGREGASR